MLVNNWVVSQLITCRCHAAEDVILVLKSLTWINVTIPTRPYSSISIVMYDHQLHILKSKYIQNFTTIINKTDIKKEGKGHLNYRPLWPIGDYLNPG